MKAHGRLSLRFLFLNSLHINTYQTTKHEALSYLPKATKVLRRLFYCISIHLGDKIRIQFTRKYVWERRRKKGIPFLNLGVNLSKRGCFHSPVLLYFSYQFWPPAIKDYLIYWKKVTTCDTHIKEAKKVYHCQYNVAWKEDLPCHKIPST